MAQQTAVEWLIDRLLDGSFRFEETEMGCLISMENGDEIDKAKAMEKQQIRDALILFCDTESYGACDIKDWVKNNGIIFKNKDTNSQIVYRVDYFVDNILNHNI